MPSAPRRRRYDDHADLWRFDVRGLQVETRNGAVDVLLSVRGEVDLSTAPELEGALQRACPPERGSLIVDLRAVTFLDSSGLALLLRHDGKVRVSGRRLIVVKGPPFVQRAFELTGVSERLTMVDEPPE